MDFYGKFHFLSDNQINSTDSESSEFKKFEQEHGISKIYMPHEKKTKLVITVIDTGIGIKKKDKMKLFKLFGCL